MGRKAIENKDKCCVMGIEHGGVGQSETGRLSRVLKGRVSVTAHKQR